MTFTTPNSPIPSLLLLPSKNEHLSNIHRGCSTPQISSAGYSASATNMKSHFLSTCSRRRRKSSSVGPVRLPFRKHMLENFLFSKQILLASAIAMNTWSLPRAAQTPFNQNLANIPPQTHSSSSSSP